MGLGKRKRDARGRLLASESLFVFLLEWDESGSVGTRSQGKKKAA